MRVKVAIAVLTGVLLVAACGDDGPDPGEVVADEPGGGAEAPGELALPRCDTIAPIGGTATVEELSTDPEVAAWQERRAELGFPSDETATITAADAPVSAPVEELGFPMTQPESEAFFTHQEVNGALASQVQESMGTEPWFGGVWIDNVARRVGIAVTSDLAGHQAAFDQEFGPGAVVAVGVERSAADLLDLQAEVTAWLGDQDLRDWGVGGMNLLNHVTVGLEVLDPAIVADLATAVGTEGICVEGAEPNEVVPEGPQPQAGEGWRLLADEPGIGRPYATGFAADENAYAALWAEIGLEGEPPAVDFTTEVVAWFGPAVSGSCPEIRMDDVRFDEATALLVPDIVRVGGARGCTDDANPHAYVVAFDRSQLPARFTVSIEPPNGECCPEANTQVDLTED